MAAFEITRRTDHAVRIVLYRARQPNREPVRYQRIAAALGIPLRSVLQVVAALHIAGLIWSSRLRNGGIALARRPGEISLRQVIEAIEGPVCLNLSGAWMPDDHRQATIQGRT